MYSRPSTALGATLVGVFLFLAIFGPLVAPYGVNQQIYADALSPPSARHLFGADNLGRDVLSRVILGARYVLGLAGTGTIAAVVVGTTLGLLAGYLGGAADEILSRLFDSVLALPALLLALLLLGALGPSALGVFIVIAVVYTPIVARVVRSAVLSTKGKGFIQAAQVQGESLPFMLFGELLPAALPALAVEASLRFSYAIFLVASLGFLGVGVQPPSPDWGLMVSEGRDYVFQAPWALYFPAGAIALVVIGVNLAADGLKRVLQAPPGSVA
jgi:peptide/nickel transport system permease protein